MYFFSKPCNAMLVVAACLQISTSTRAPSVSVLSVWIVWGLLLLFSVDSNRVVGSPRFRARDVTLLLGRTNEQRQINTWRWELKGERWKPETARWTLSGMWETPPPEVRTTKSEWLLLGAATVTLGSKLRWYNSFLSEIKWFATCFLLISHPSGSVGEP